MKVGAKRVRIFKIRNRKGYAVVCLNHITEGRSVFQAYSRMTKALRRNGLILEKLPADKLKKLIVNL